MRSNLMDQISGLEGCGMTIDFKCPECGSGRYYLLNDNRLLCRDCRRKYSPARYRSRLPDESIFRICESFWGMKPVSEVAADLSMNRKTIQRYYDLLRRGISGVTETFLLDQYGTTEVSSANFHAVGQGEPMFCVARCGKRLDLFSVTAETGGSNHGSLSAGWIYARDRRALQCLDLDQIHYLPVGDGGAGGHSFWGFAKKGLVSYCGGFRKNFYHFVREMEFRFNNRGTPNVCEVLREIVSRDITNLRGDENV